MLRSRLPPSHGLRACSVRSGILLGLLKATFRAGPAHIVLLGTVTIEDRSQERPEPSRQSARKKRQGVLDFRQHGAGPLTERRRDETAEWASRSISCPNGGQLIALRRVALSHCSRNSLHCASQIAERIGGVGFLSPALGIALASPKSCVPQALEAPCRSSPRQGILPDGSPSRVRKSAADARCC